MHGPHLAKLPQSVLQGCGGGRACCTVRLHELFDVHRPLLAPGGVVRDVAGGGHGHLQDITYVTVVPTSPNESVPWGFVSV